MRTKEHSNKILLCVNSEFKRKIYPMDNFDHQILKIMQNNCRTSTEQMGADIGLSATACQRRIKKLRELGIIEKEVAIVDSKALGGYVTILVEVIVKRGGSDEIEKFKHAMLSHEEVQQCYYVTGNADFILVITAQTMHEYEAITQRLFFSNDNIQKFHSNVVMDNVKVGLNIPIKALPY